MPDAAKRGRSDSAAAPRWLAALQWVAVNEMYYRGPWRRSYEVRSPRRRGRTFGRREGYAWLEPHQPVAIVGGSIRLYRIDE